MPYLVCGNMEQLFFAFDYPGIVAHSDAQDVSDKDIPRTSFIGSEADAKQHLKLWQQKLARNYYAQGNMTAGVLQLLFGPEPFKKSTETFEECKMQYVCRDFAYIDDQQQACGFMVMYRRDDPSQWVIGCLKKGQDIPKNRKVMLLSSFDPGSAIKKPVPGVTIKAVSLVENPLMEQLGAAIPREVLKKVLNTNGEITKHFERIKFLTRFFSATAQEVVLRDPINFSKLNLEKLFGENPTLDLIEQYGLDLSFAMLQDCLVDGSGLSHELTSIKLTDNQKLNKNLLRMTLTFYEDKTLEENRDLLNDLEFIRLFGALMWDKRQIKLIPFLRSKNYDTKLMQFILSDEIYYGAVSRLVEMGLTQDVLALLEDLDKREELKFIHELADEDCKRLCLVFWVKDALTIERYNELVAATERYPLMASTLVDLDKKGVVIGGVEGLRQMALAPKEHLQKSIVHHFFSADNEHFYVKSLDKLSLDELDAASKALNVLKNSGSDERKQYRLIVGHDKQAKSLRIFLPQIAAIKNRAARQELINILFKGINLGIAIQGQAVLQLGDKEIVPLAKDLCDRFICVTQLQDLDFADEVATWVAQEHNKKARCFRQIVLQVEERCKQISTRLSSTVHYRDMHVMWQQEEANYRKNLYTIAYATLMNPNGSKGAELNKAIERINAIEKDILRVLDPPVESDIYKALIVITNILITALTLGLANYIKFKTTGNPWFFTQTKLGEEVRAGNKKIIDTIKSEDEEPGESPQL